MVGGGQPLEHSTRCAIVDSILSADPLGELTIQVPEEALNPYATVIAVDIAPANDTYKQDLASVAIALLHFLPHSSDRIQLNITQHFGFHFVQILQQGLDVRKRKILRQFPNPVVKGLISVLEVQLDIPPVFPQP